MVLGALKRGMSGLRVRVSPLPRLSPREQLRLRRHAALNTRAWRRALMKRRAKRLRRQAIIGAALGGAVTGTAGGAVGYALARKKRARGQG